MPNVSENNKEMIGSLLQFLKASVSPFHATKELASLFQVAGFHRLDESEAWSLQAGEGYYYTRADSSFVAFRHTEKYLEKGLRIVGAHTDSPCLKIKPTPEIFKQNCALLGIEVYGGALLNPWFDRDLSLAGKVTGTNQKGELVSAIINFEKAIATVPSLAIHLNREANKNKTVNPQTEMNALLSLGAGKLNKESTTFRELLLAQVKKEHPDSDFKEILDFNICLYDVQPPALIGLNDDFISSARLDNLLSCFIGAYSLIHSNTDECAVLICNDHEEVGSRSEAGAQGTMLTDLLARLIPDSDVRHRTLRYSMMFSVDNAHGIHPNYESRHDNNHGPLLNSGPVIKFDADQSYATSSDTAAIVRWLAKQGEVLPLQSFVTRADCRCGSTIGPITATKLGVQTVDIGNAQFAMHSCRELAGAEDAIHLSALLSRFYAAPKVHIQGSLHI